MIRVLDRRLIFSLALAVLILLLNSALDYRNTKQLHDFSKSIVHSESVLDSLDKLLLSMVDAETGERGFLITGDERYLEPYFRAVSAVHGESGWQFANELSTVTADVSGRPESRTGGRSFVSQFPFGGNHERQNG